ncbi:MAG: hypothetical protein AAB922_01800 [Patescibacteria group bacterium]
MTEILLIIIILAQMGYSAYRDYLNLQEKKKLINALTAKTSEDLATLDATDKLKVGETEPIPPDMTSLDEVPQEDWEKAVLGDGK